jgi:hypothetical protein
VDDDLRRVLEILDALVGRIEALEARAASGASGRPAGGLGETGEQIAAPRATRPSTERAAWGRIAYRPDAAAAASSKAADTRGSA